MRVCHDGGQAYDSLSSLARWLNKPATADHYGAMANEVRACDGGGVVVVMVRGGVEGCVHGNA